MSLKKWAFILGTLCWAMAFSAAGAEKSDLASASPAATPEPSPAPVVTITSPPIAKNRRYFLFPLKIPAYIMRGVSWPLIEGVRFAERKFFHRGAKLEGEEKPPKFSVLPIIQAGGGEGFGLGFSFELFDLFGAGDLATDYTFFFDIENRANLGFTFDPIELGGRPLEIEFLARFRDRNEAQFFGIGSETREQDQTFYAYNQLHTGVNLNYEVFKNFSIQLPLQFLTAEADPSGAGEQPSVQVLFPPSELPYLGDRTSYFVTGLALVHDTRDSKAYPLEGGYRAFRFSRYQGLESGYSFNQYDIDISQTFKLSPHRYSLTLRNAWTFQQATGDSEIPFNLLAQMDHYSPLRGFPVGRWRDTSSVVFNLEYKFPIWSYTSTWGVNRPEPFLDGILFVDTGRVFPGIGDFSFDDWKWSVGGGMNFMIKDFFIMHLEIGYGGEGPLVFYRMGKRF